MLYTRAHVRALEAQISRLEHLLAEEKTEHRRALAEEKAERQALLDRLLAKNNVEPVQAPAPAKLPDSVQVFHPFGSAATPEMVDALKESWLAEEAQYLMAEEGITDAQAREMAERRWLSQHKAT